VSLGRGSYLLVRFTPFSSRFSLIWGVNRSGFGSSSVAVSYARSAGQALGLSGATQEQGRSSARHSLTR